MNIKKAIQDAIEYIANGWDLDLAINCAHDTVYDEIEIESFLDAVKAEIRERTK